MKGRVNWSSVREDISHIRLGPILSNPDPVSALNEELKRIISRRVPVKKICLRSNDKAWFNVDYRAARDSKQAAYHRWSRLRTRETWEESLLPGLPVQLSIGLPRTNILPLQKKSYPQHLTRTSGGPR